MDVVTFRCVSCGDEWSVPDPDEPRETCTECGSRLVREAEEVEA